VVFHRWGAAAGGHLEKPPVEDHRLTSLVGSSRGHVFHKRYRGERRAGATPLDGSARMPHPRGFPSVNPATDWTPTTARWWKDAQVVAPT
jgi:hypothetical protein